jgi:hypothetical protein
VNDTPDTPEGAQPSESEATAIFKRLPSEPPRLLESIMEKLADLAQHAGSHGYREGVLGRPIDKRDAPECVVQHVHELALSMWSLAPADQFNKEIVLPRDLPEGLRDQVQAAIDADQVNEGEPLPVDLMDQMTAFARDHAAGHRQAGDRR